MKTVEIDSQKFCTCIYHCVLFKSLGSKGYENCFQISWKWDFVPFMYGVYSL